MNEKKSQVVKKITVSNESLFLSAIQTAIGFVLKLRDNGFFNETSDSLVSFTKSTRVEPITLVDQSIAHSPYIKNILQTLNSIFAAYYLQAVSLSVNVGRVEVLKLLSSLNPESNPSFLSLENQDFVNDPVFKVAFESNNSNNEDEERNDNEFEKGSVKKSHTANPKNSVKPSLSGSSVQKFVEKINESVDLSLGKLIEVTIEDNGKKATFPISIRLISNIVSSDLLVHILGDNSKNRTFLERYHLWKADAIEFWRDLVLCQDLIDEHKQALIKDKSGVYEEILKRRRNNIFDSLKTYKPSIGTASNLLVISKETLKTLESNILGRFSDFKTREKVFRSTYLMIVVVFDPEFETVTIYHRGIGLPTMLNAREIKAPGGKSDVNILEVLQAYQLGKAPVI